MRKFPQYIDGYYGVPVRISRTPREYPFGQNGDIVTAVYTATYLVDADSFTPTARGTVDPENAGFYLIAETKPEIFQGNLAQFVRTYSRVPAQQIVPGSLFITKPALTGTFPQVIGEFLAIQPDATIPSYLFYTQKTLSTDSGAPSSNITSGTWTLTLGANTTAAIAFDEVAATVQTALNGLASITAAGGVTVAGTHLAGFTVTFGAYAAATVATGSLAASGGTVSGSVVIASSGKVQTVSIRPAWSPASPSAASSFTPSAANPVSWTNVGSGFTGIGIYRGNYSLTGEAATGGTFTVSVYGQTTAAIAWNADNTTVAAAINALSEASSRGGYAVTNITLNGLPGIAAQLATDAAITSGTFTLTVLGETTGAIAYNASLATIQTAINALTNVTARGGVIVSGAGFAGGQMNFTFTFANTPALSASGASLVPSGSSVFCAVLSSDGRTQSISFTALPSTVRNLVASTAHGITIADDILLTNSGGTTHALAAGSFAVPNASTLELASGSGLLSTAGTFTAVGKRTGTTYTAGLKLTRIKRVTDFYLPSVTPGIATMDDIPLPAFQGDDASLLAAIFAGSPSINYEVGELAQWRESPILSRTIVTLNAAQL